MSAARLFQSTRRQVQRRVVSAVLACALLLIAVYALIVISTGIFVLYVQLNGAADLMRGAVDVEPAAPAEFGELQEKREETDPIVHLLRSVDVDAGDDVDEGQTNNEMQEAAAVDPAFIEQRLSFEFGVYRLMRFRSARRKRSADFDSLDRPFKLRSTNTTENVNAANTRGRRQLCSVTLNPESSNDVFPPDLFSAVDRRRGAVVLHLCALCYIFIALAIVCDAFLVPSIDIISEVMEISDDVAGATLMAGAGSAPEAFTSLFGVFVTQNNVGVGTIVGSAVFNILFVLSFCAFFSHEVLHLTWWPMIRDICFYLFALFLLFVFFFDGKIDWHEALILLLLYLGYCVFMRYNIVIERMVKRQLARWSAVVSTDDSSLVQNNNSKATPHQPTIRDMPIFVSTRTIPLLHSGAIFRSGFMQIAFEPSTLTACRQSESSSLPGERSLLTTPTPLFTKRLSQPAMRRIGTPLVRVEKASSSSPTPNESGIYKEDHLSATSRTATPNSQIWSTISSASNIHHYRNPTPPTVERKNRSKVEPKRRRSGDPDINQPMEMRWPSTFYKKCVFVFLAPITFPLYVTLPDLKKPEHRKFYLWTFVGSVLWIAGFSYLMVWMAQTIGETFGVPNEIMGLTILAAGTSIPDLITSIIVARKGCGDMAVSSSIGSNLFDICVGLPVPWLIYYSIHTIRDFRQTVKQISVESKGLVCSIGILFTTLSLLYGTVAFIGWRMNKKFGFIMLGAYLLFCALSVLLEVGVLSCPISRSAELC